MAQARKKMYRKKKGKVLKVKKKSQREANFSKDWQIQKRYTVILHEREFSYYL